MTQVQDRQQRGGDRRALSDISQYRGQETGELYTAMGPGGIGQFVFFLCLVLIHVVEICTLLSP